MFSRQNLEDSMAPVYHAISNFANVLSTFPENSRFCSLDVIQITLISNYVLVKSVGWLNPLQFIPYFNIIY